jgi:hypothetical protein
MRRTIAFACIESKRRSEEDHEKRTLPARRHGRI